MIMALNVPNVQYGLDDCENKDCENIQQWWRYRILTILLKMLTVHYISNEK